MADWAPLSETDPLPGDPNGLAELVGLLRSEVLEIRDALNRLGSVNSEEFWEGEAASIFADTRGQLAYRMQMVVGRIQTSADALNGFVPAMGDCQSRARMAVNRARDAEAALARAHQGAEDAARQAAADKAAADAFAEANPGVTPPPPAASWGPNWQGMIEEAEQERAAAARQFAAAVDDYETAANHCADALGPAIADSLRNPQHHGFFSGVVHAVEGVAHTAVNAFEDVGKAAVDGAAWLGHETFEHLDTISDGLGFAAMVTGFFPPLKGMSLALSGAKMAVDTAAVLAGQGDWSKVRNDAIGVALFGLGRGLTGVARSRVGLAAATKVETDTEMLRAAMSKAAEGEEGVEQTLKVARLGVNIRRTSEVADEFAKDAARPLLRETVAMVRDFKLEVPGRAALSLSRGAVIAAGAHQGLEMYEHYDEFKELRELNEKYKILPGTPTEE
jgi:hypothetical protein